MAKFSKLIIFPAWLAILPLLALVCPAAVLADWSAPSLAPTSLNNLAIGNSLPPIDIGGEAQTKWGPLLIGGNFQAGGLAQFLNMTGVGNWFATLANVPREVLDVDGIVRANNFCLRKFATDGSPDTTKCLSGLFTGGGTSSSAGVTSLTAGTNISLSPANPLNSTNPTGSISATSKAISCPAGQALVSISQNGTPTCTALPPAGSATSPVTGLTSSDNSVAISTTPSPPYSSTAPGIQVNRSVIQARVTGSCQGSGGMTSVGSDGSVSCAPYPPCSISGKTITCGATSVTSQ